MAATGSTRHRVVGGDNDSGLALPPDKRSDTTDPLDWFAEARRLFVEAEERFEAGSVLPTLSPLAAVPPLHHMLVDRCSELLGSNDATEVVESPPSIGMYL